MNCYRCGEEIKELAGYVCQPCVDGAVNKAAGELAEMAGEEKYGSMELSPKDAVIAMLRGATLQNNQGMKFKWSEPDKTFINTEALCAVECFGGLYYVSTKKTHHIEEQT